MADKGSVSELAASGEKCVITFDFDDTLTKWADEGGWRQVPNKKYIEQYYQPFAKPNFYLAVVTFRTPTPTTPKPKYNHFAKIPDFLREHGLTAFKDILYSAAGRKSPVILGLCERVGLHFGMHFDDDVRSVEDVRGNPELQKIAINPELMAMQVARGVKPNWEAIYPGSH